MISLLFLQHNTEGYINLMFQGRTQLETVIPKQSDFTKPCVKRIEVHHFSHRQTASISIDGENLYFTYHCKLQMKYNDSKSELSFRVDNQKAISNQSIQLQNQQIDIPPDILDSSNSTGDNEYQEFCGSATVTLQTHFQEEIIFSDIPVKHKVCNHYSKHISLVCKQYNITSREAHFASSPPLRMTVIIS